MLRLLEFEHPPPRGQRPTVLLLLLLLGRGCCSNGFCSNGLRELIESVPPSAPHISCRCVEPERSTTPIPALRSIFCMMLHAVQGARFEGFKAQERFLFVPHIIVWGSYFWGCSRRRPTDDHRPTTTDRRPPTDDRPTDRPTDLLLAPSSSSLLLSPSSTHTLDTPTLTH